MNRVFEVLSSEIKYENPWLKVVELRTNTDGKEGIYGVVERPNSATLIIESSDKRVLFVRQYRYPTDSYSWELPMGGIEKDEPPQGGALRELEEETGCSMELERIGEFYPVPGLTPQVAYVYHGKVPDEQIAIVEANEEMTDEITERRFFNHDDIQSLISSKEITDGFTLSSLAIYFLEAKR